MSASSLAIWLKHEGAADTSSRCLRPRKRRPPSVAVCCRLGVLVFCQASLARARRRHRRCSVWKAPRRLRLWCQLQLHLWRQLQIQLHLWR